MTRWTEEQLEQAKKRLGGRHTDRVERPTVDSTDKVDIPVPLKTVKTKKRSKYGAVRTNGYASAKEAKRAAELKLLEKAGKIRNLREQVVYELLPKQEGERKVTYRADFVYEQVDSLGKVHKVCEDVKGFSTSYYILKRKMLLFFHGIQIRQT